MQEHVLKTLTDEDLDMVLQLLLASGSLKELARRYQVSYPTIRVRLDRLLERVQARLEGREQDPMAERLADAVERGETGAATARELLRLHRALLDEMNSKP
jgi:hypothetical protein